MKSIKSCISIMSVCLLASCATNSDFDNQGQKTSPVQGHKNQMCPAMYAPVCAKEEVNGQAVFNSYSNSCMMQNQAKGKVISVTDGNCK